MGETSRELTRASNQIESLECKSKELVEKGEEIRKVTLSHCWNLCVNVSIGPTSCLQLHALVYASSVNIFMSICSLSVWILFVCPQSVCLPLCAFNKYSVGFSVLLFFLNLLISHSNDWSCSQQIQREADRIHPTVYFSREMIWKRRNFLKSNSHVKYRGNIGRSWAKSWTLKMKSSWRRRNIWKTWSPDWTFH